MMLFRTGLCIRVQLGEFRADGTFIVGAWQPVSVALLNTVVDSDDGNSALRRHVTRAFQIWPTPLESIVQEGISSGSFAPMSIQQMYRPNPDCGDTETCSGDQPIAIQPKRALASPATPERIPLIYAFPQSGQNNCAGPDPTSHFQTSSQHVNKSNDG
jgi:hypothetical protein